MEALTHDVLKEGLNIQQALLGPEAVCLPSSDDGYNNGVLPGNRPGLPLMPSGMFFHSPLLYWNCSLSAVEQDRRILETVNDNISRRSAAKITLRWGSVFAGKHFSHQKLIAADALVISLFYALNSTAGQLWDQRAAELVREARSHGRYQIYPENGQEDYNTLYEVRPPGRIV
jgi:hypothetical protein